MLALNNVAPPLHAVWTENDQARTARWPAENNSPPPKRIITADDTLSADDAYRLVSQGTSLLWRGDFHNARQLLQALARRIDKPKKAPRKKAELPTPLAVFNQHRLHQSQRTQLLNRLLIELDSNAAIALRRAPDVADACQAALGQIDEPFLLSLRALQGIIGAHEWQKKGVAIPALAHNIHVHYGVFSPNRGEYIDLVAQAPLPTKELAFDIGTGSGVLAAVLAQRGVRKVIGTDQDPRALACARENIERLGLSKVIDLQTADLFPVGASALIVCNPPWLPAKPTTPIERAIYDPESRMLLGFLNGLAGHLTPDGEGWLIMSDLAEHLGLRSRDFLLQAIAAAGLRVVDRMDAHPKHPKAVDETDPLHEARRLEITSLWRLARA
jgi:methylase of polypeptide subunit release factors